MSRYLFQRLFHVTDETCIGHGGHDTADYTVANLPSLIRSSLYNILEADPSPSPNTIADLLSKTISSFDAALTTDFLALFPGGEEALNRMSDDEIKSIINDQDRGGRNAAIVTRCMRGTTALVTLVDPGKENAWVASLGDCVAGQYLHHSPQSFLSNEKFLNPRFALMSTLLIM